ncbi:M4 family metallopeptidase [Oceanirhabdus sp. W0125-5]|uniref:M4 family metallopeptidase n=1 Tax=Oceanirhabdus sp. W0125-5 TaxID=2999116 RepID=UPI0022F31E68|nr:M4 family metallopeptidase [Oceanirhabdus sp. W0125-5]WBW95721.1 M4 family metallopeptidase [Oceanirhabdus sp. W0125-5]
MKNKFLTILLVLVFAFSPLSTALAKSENGKINWNKKHGTPEFISGQLTNASNESAEEVLYKYLDNSKDKFKFGKGNAKEAFKITSKKIDKLGYTNIKLQQVYKGIPVFGSTQAAHIDKNGVLTSISGAVIPNLDKHDKLKLDKKINKNEAIKKAQEDLTFEPEYEVKPEADLVVYYHENEARYAYLVNLNFLYPEPGNWNYFIDAVTGELINKYNNLKYGKPTKKPTSGEDTVGTGTGVLGDTKEINTLLSNSIYYLVDRTRGDGIETYNANNRTRLPGSLWADSDNVLNDSNDRAAVDAHHYAGLTYDYYLNRFSRNSFDNKGSLIKATVHYSRSYNNAFWNGQQIVFGDGDGVTFTELSGSLDVIAHEITHAVTEHTADLIYYNESGALNEAMSDIFGTAVEFAFNNNPDWLIGEDIYTPADPNDAMRSMADPTKYGDPDHYDDRYVGTADNGGVHWNSGIINKAAYLISEGGRHYGVTVSGIGIDKMTEIFYRALTQHFTASSTFSQARAALVQSAVELYGANSAEVQAVNDAFDSVGVN